MRKYKFRGKRLDGKGWIYGSLFNGLTQKLIMKVTSIKPESENTYPMVGYEVDPATVREFTGKKDKNGKEIYENHRVKVQYPNAYHPSITGEVVFEEGCWMIKGDDDDYWLLYSEVLGPIEVIHDNPELLEK